MVNSREGKRLGIRKMNELGSENIKGLGVIKN